MLKIVNSILANFNHHEFISQNSSRFKSEEIGGRSWMSNSDVLKLKRKYNCDEGNNGSFFLKKNILLIFTANFLLIYLK